MPPSRSRLGQASHLSCLDSCVKSHIQRRGPSDHEWRCYVSGCEEQARSEKALHIHLHNEHTARCDLCGAWFDDEDTHNQESHAICLLPECQAVCTTPHDLKVHYKVDHPAECCIMCVFFLQLSHFNRINGASETYP